MTPQPSTSSGSREAERILYVNDNPIIPGPSLEPLELATPLLLAANETNRDI